MEVKQDMLQAPACSVNVPFVLIEAVEAETSAAMVQPTLGALMALAVVTLVLLAVLRLTQRFLNWRRLAAWEAAWPAIDPRWTGYRP